MTPAAGRHQADIDPVPVLRLDSFIKGVSGRVAVWGLRDGPEDGRELPLQPITITDFVLATYDIAALDGREAWRGDGRC